MIVLGQGPSIESDADSSYSDAASKKLEVTQDIGGKLRIELKRLLSSDNFK